MYLCPNDPFPGPAPNAWRETECRTRGLSKDGPSLRTEVDELLLLYLAELQPLAWGWQESNLRPFPKREEISSFTTGLAIFR